MTSSSRAVEEKGNCFFFYFLVCVSPCLLFSGKNVGRRVSCGAVDTLLTRNLKFPVVTLCRGEERVNWYSSHFQSIKQITRVEKFPWLPQWQKSTAKEKKKRKIGRGGGKTHARTHERAAALPWRPFNWIRLQEKEGRKNERKKHNCVCVGIYK